MSRTVWLTGALPFVLLASAALTAPLAAFLLWLYRRAVLRSMAQSAGVPVATPAPDCGWRTTAAWHAPAGRVCAAAAPSDAYRRGRRAHRRTALAHGLAGLAYAAVFTAVWMLWVTPDGFLPGRTLWLLSSYWWPTVIILGLLVMTSSRERLLLAGGYTLVLAAIGIYLLAYNPTLSPLHLLTFWATTNAPETVLVLAFLARRIRAVGPLGSPSRRPHHRRAIPAQHARAPVAERSRRLPESDARRTVGAYFEVTHASSTRDRRAALSAAGGADADGRAARRRHDAGNGIAPSRDGGHTGPGTIDPVGDEGRMDSDDELRDLLAGGPPHRGAGRAPRSGEAGALRARLPAPPWLPVLPANPVYVGEDAVGRAGARDARRDASRPSTWSTSSGASEQLDAHLDDMLAVRPRLVWLQSGIRNDAVRAPRSSTPASPWCRTAVSWSSIAGCSAVERDPWPSTRSS